jgi:hypothetical protein
MAGLTEFYCGSNEPSHASQFKWLEYTFKGRAGCLSFYFVTKGNVSCTRMKIMDTLYLLFSDVFHSKFMGDFAS